MPVTRAKAKKGNAAITISPAKSPVKAKPVTRAMTRKQAPKQKQKSSDKIEIVVEPVKAARIVQTNVEESPRPKRTQKKTTRGKKVKPSADDIKMAEEVRLGQLKKFANLLNPENAWHKKVSETILGVNLSIKVKTRAAKKLLADTKSNFVDGRIVAVEQTPLFRSMKSAASTQKQKRKRQREEDVKENSRDAAPVKRRLVELQLSSNSVPSSAVLQPTNTDTLEQSCETGNQELNEKCTSNNVELQLPSDSVPSSAVLEPTNTDTPEQSYESANQSLVESEFNEKCISNNVELQLSSDSVPSSAVLQPTNTDTLEQSCETGNEELNEKCTSNNVELQLSLSSDSVPSSAVLQPTNTDTLEQSCETGNQELDEKCTSNNVELRLPSDSVPSSAVLQPNTDTLEQSCETGNQSLVELELNEKCTSNNVELQLSSDSVTSAVLQLTNTDTLEQSCETGNQSLVELELTGKSISNNYEISRLEEILDEDNNHRQNKKIPMWARDGALLQWQLFLSNPILMERVMVDMEFNITDDEDEDKFNDNNTLDDMSFPYCNTTYKLFPGAEAPRPRK